MSGGTTAQRKEVVAATRRVPHLVDDLFSAASGHQRLGQASPQPGRPLDRELRDFDGLLELLASELVVFSTQRTPEDPQHTGRFLVGELRIGKVARQQIPYRIAVHPGSP